MTHDPLLSNPKKVEARRLKGFQDIHGPVMRLREKLIAAVRVEAELAGFQTIATPALEYADVLLGSGGETEKQMFRFFDNGERDVALRFDLTVPLARYLAEHQGTLSLPFRRLQIGEVWRAEKPQKGRYREFCQCDLDIVGVDTASADLEILGSFARVLERVAPSAFTMRLGDRRVLSGLIRALLGQDLHADQENRVLIGIDKLDKISPEAVCTYITSCEAEAEQTVTAPLDQTKTRELLRLLQIGTAAQIAEVLAPDTVALAAYEQLQATLALAQQHVPWQLGKIQIDLTVARGLGYYTGMVFETLLDQHSGIGSICSGGRYDKLVERFSTRECPGVGGSLGLDRLLAVLQDQPDQVKPFAHAVYIAMLDAENDLSAGFGLAQALRAAGVPCELPLRSQKLGQQFKRAAQAGFAYVLTLGSDEISQGVCRVKHMASGDELVLAQAVVPDWLKQKLS